MEAQDPAVEALIKQYQLEGRQADVFREIARLFYAGGVAANAYDFPTATACLGKIDQLLPETEPATKNAYDEYMKLYKTKIAATN